MREIPCCHCLLGPDLACLVMMHVMSPLSPCSSQLRQSHAHCVIKQSEADEILMPLTFTTDRHYSLRLGRLRVGQCSMHSQERQGDRAWLCRKSMLAHEHDYFCSPKSGHFIN